MTLIEGVTMMAHSGSVGDVFRAVSPGQAGELVRKFRWAQRRLDEVVALLERAGLGDALVAVGVTVDDAGEPVGYVELTPGGVVRLVELLRCARLSPGPARSPAVARPDVA